MHTEWDTATRDRTLALYGAKHRSNTYYAVRFLARTALIVAVVILPHALAYTLVPA